MIEKAEIKLLTDDRIEKSNASPAPLMLVFGWFGFEIKSRQIAQADLYSQCSSN